MSALASALTLAGSAQRQPSSFWVQPERRAGPALQGTNMAAPDWSGWRKGFYLPTSSDAGVVVMRKWLDQVAGEGRPRAGPGSRAVLLLPLVLPALYEPQPRA